VSYVHFSESHEALRGTSEPEPASYLILFFFSFSMSFSRTHKSRTRTRINTNPNGTEANAAGRSGNARALRKQSKCGMIQEGEGHWPNSSNNLQKARNLWVLRTPQNNKEEGA